MHIRLSGATVDLSVLEHKIVRKKVGAGEEQVLGLSVPTELNGQEPQPRPKHLQEDVIVSTRLLNTSVHLEHYFSYLKSLHTSQSLPL